MMPNSRGVPTRPYRKSLTSKGSGGSPVSGNLDDYPHGLPEVRDLESDEIGALESSLPEEVAIRLALVEIGVVVARAGSTAAASRDPGPASGTSGRRSKRPMPPVWTG